MRPEHDPTSTVLFLHLPKTAGTTLNSIIDAQYPAAAIHSLGADTHAAVAAFEALPAAERAGFKIIRGHFPYGFHAAVPGSTTYFTLLRDPVARVISYYNYIRRTPPHYLHERVMRDRLTLRELLETGEALMMNDGMVRLLSGVWGERPFGGVTDADRDEAARVLRDVCSVVGLTEAFDPTLLLLQRAFGWRDLSYRRLNVGRGARGRRPARSRSTIDDATRAAIEACNQHDLAVYRLARELFAAQVRAQGPLFPLAVWRFRLWNRTQPLYWRLRRFSVRATVRAWLSGT